MSLALSLCQYVLRPWRGLAQASPGLAWLRPGLGEPRSALIAGLHQHNRKGKIVMIKTRRYKRLVFGFDFAPETDMIFGDGVGACSRPLLPTRYWFVWRWCVSTLEQRSWRRCMGGLKTGPSRRHRIQPAEGPFLDPRAKETCFKKGSESGPLEIKRGPPWRVQFWSLFGPFNVANLLRRLFQVEADLPATAAAGILNWGRPFLRACFFLRFEVPKAPSLSYCFAPISIAAKPALTCFVPISMVLRHWSSRLALRPASNFVSSYNFFLVCYNFHNLEALRLALRPSLCASCGLKF